MRRVVGMCGGQLLCDVAYYDVGMVISDVQNRKLYFY